MSECVVRMEMPKNCRSCPLCKFIGASPECALKKYPLDTVSQYYYADKKPSNCPIICSLPEGHGRLVDADALVNQWATVPDKLAAGAGENKWVADMVMGIQGHFLEGIIKSIEEAPTIVPAERSET